MSEMGEESKKGNRIAALDLIRFVAICAVLMLHTVSGISDTIPGEMTTLQLRVYRCIVALCAFGVPCFLMISGALLLDPGKRIPLKDLLCRYIRRVALAILLFGTLFAYAELIAGEGMGWRKALPEAFIRMLTAHSWAHLWYLYALLGLYLLLPLLKIFTATVPLRLQGVLLLLCCCLFSLLPFLAEHTALRLPARMPHQPIYLLYFVAGHMLYRTKEYIKRPILAESAVVCVGAFALILFNFIAQCGWNMTYNSPVIALYAVALFVLLLHVRGAHDTAARIAPYVFGMYLTHAVFLNLCYKILHITPLILGGFALIPLFFAATFLFALTASYILRLVPLLRNYVL